jgi:glutamate N-acetyltransferase/amino-acid N-acetyltransferase
MKKIKGGITAPIGFSATGAHVGLKRTKKDLAIIQTNSEAIYAGTFTKNVVKAACVKWNMERFNNNDRIRAIVVNSGNANACTGEAGTRDNMHMATTVAKGISSNMESVLVASTGVIGVPLPIDIVTQGIEIVVPNLGYSVDDGTLAAEAIMTTDTFTKEIAVNFEIDGNIVTVGGMSKGSGMIHPNMATMLGIFITDININKELLQKNIYLLRFI